MVDDAKERLYMKDLYCSYYTESDEITSYMISKLKIMILYLNLWLVRGFLLMV